MTALVTKHLPLVAGAPDGIKKLRGLILDLATRGKLVAQDNSEEDASLLLGRLSAKSLKEWRKAAPLGMLPFDLPSGWVWARLGSLTTLITSGSRDWAKHYSDEGAIFVRMGNLSKGSYALRLDNIQRVSPPSKGEGNRTKLEARDLLISITGDVGLLGLIPDGFGDAYINQHTCLVRFCDEIQGRFFPEVLRSPLAIAQYSAPQRGIKNSFRLSDVVEMLVPVPPLAEQHRILAKVDELMALCDRLEADQADAEAAHAQLVQALLDSLTQATDPADFRASWHRLSEHFHSLFTTEVSIDALKQTTLQLAVMGKLVPQDSSEESVKAFLQRLDDARSKQDADRAIRSRAHLSNSDVMASPLYDAPNGWTWRNLGSLLNITGGVTLGRKLAGRKLVSKPYLRVANVQRSYLVLDQVKQVEVPEDEVEKYRLLPNDLLITEGGDWDKVGRTAIWHGEIADCLHQNHVFRARAPSAEFSHRWAELYLNAQPARDYFAGSSKQTTNLASINMTQLRACAFPVPPLPEQHRIVAKVDELMALCDQLKAQLAEARQQHAQLATVLVEQGVA